MTTTDSLDAAPFTAGAHPRQRVVPASSQPPVKRHVRVARVVRAELIKLRSVRSMVSAIVITALSILGIGAFSAVGLVAADPPPDGGADAATADPLGASLTGVSFAVYVVATLGVLAVTSEYATGTIKSTLAAVPRRAEMVLGKVVALAVTTLAVALPSLLAAFFAAKAVLATEGLSIELTAPGVLRALVGAALYLTVVAVLSAGLGWLLRNAAGALATLFGVLAVLPVIGFFLPPAIGQKILPYLPNNAGTAIMQLTPGDQLGPWTGFGLFAGYAIIVLAVATMVLHHRDA